MALITQGDNPTLWATLNSLYVSYGSGHVTVGTVLYRCHQLSDGSIAFEEIDNMDYIDSRSITGSKSASYTKLDDG